MTRYRNPAPIARSVLRAQIRNAELTAISSQNTNRVIRSPANTAPRADPA